VVIPPRLKQKARMRARTAGFSFGEFVRRALERAVAENSTRRSRQRDPFLDDRVRLTGDIPKDLSGCHAFFLYGEGWVSTRYGGSKLLLRIIAPFARNQPMNMPQKKGPVTGPSVLNLEG